jgi:hypothetical protein
VVVWRIAPYQQAKPRGADQLKLEEPRTETEWLGRMDSNLGEVQVLRIEQVIAIVRDGVEPVVAECGRIEDARACAVAHIGFVQHQHIGPEW